MSKDGLRELTQLSEQMATDAGSCYSCFPTKCDHGGLWVYVCAWVGQPLPENFVHGVIRKVTLEEVLALFNNGSDVALLHTPTGIPTLAIDQKGKRFSQR